MKINIKNRGFSLLEVLIAVAVLTMIVLMMSQVFQQSSGVWQGALHQNGLDMAGRGLLARIQTDLEQAVPASNYTNKVAGYNPGNEVRHTFGASMVEFIILRDNEAWFVKYEWQSDELRRSEAKLVKSIPGGNQFAGWSKPSYSGSSALGDRASAAIQNIEFAITGGNNYELPERVDILMKLEYPGADFQTFAGRSYGPFNASRDENSKQAVYVGGGN